jgi:hypothetical protein
VKTDHNKAAARREDPDGLGQHCLQRGQLVIHRYAQGLECARCRMDALPVLLPDRSSYDVYQLLRRGEGTRSGNSPGNGARPSLLTKPKQEFLQFTA